MIVRVRIESGKWHPGLRSSFATTWEGSKAGSQKVLDQIVGDEGVDAQLCDVGSPSYHEAKDRRMKEADGEVLATSAS
eukprot:scaffold4233_cov153-Pinguiococcus_pyrenoidosus.AAC.2